MALNGGGIICVNSVTNINLHTKNMTTELKRKRTGKSMVTLLLNGTVCIVSILLCFRLPGNCLD